MAKASLDIEVGMVNIEEWRQQIEYANQLAHTLKATLDQINATPLRVSVESVPEREPSAAKCLAVLERLNVIDSATARSIRLSRPVLFMGDAD